MMEYTAIPVEWFRSYLGGVKLSTLQCCSDRSSEQLRPTLERIDRAITFTAYCLKQWKMPELLPTLKRLKAERDRVAEEGDAFEYADKILAQSAKLIEQPAGYLPAPQNRDQSAINA